MWVLKNLVCIVRKHIFAAITMRDLPYQYCLRCGKLELRDTNSHDIAEPVVASTVERTE